MKSQLNAAMAKLTAAGYTTTKDLANFLGLSTTTINNAKNGVFSPATLAKFEAAANTVTPNNTPEPTSEDASEPSKQTKRFKAALIKAIFVSKKLFSIEFIAKYLNIEISYVKSFLTTNQYTNFIEAKLPIKNFKPNLSSNHNKQVREINNLLVDLNPSNKYLITEQILEEFFLYGLNYQYIKFVCLSNQDNLFVYQPSKFKELGESQIYKEIIVFETQKLVHLDFQLFQVRFELANLGFKSIEFAECCLSIPKGLLKKCLETGLNIAKVNNQIKYFKTQLAKSIDIDFSHRKKLTWFDAVFSEDEYAKLLANPFSFIHEINHLAPSFVEPGYNKIAGLRRSINTFEGKHNYQDFGAIYRALERVERRAYTESKVTKFAKPVNLDAGEYINALSKFVSYLTTFDELPKHLRPFAAVILSAITGCRVLDTQEDWQFDFDSRLISFTSRKNLMQGNVLCLISDFEAVHKLKMLLNQTPLEIEQSRELVQAYHMLYLVFPQLAAHSYRYIRDIFQSFLLASASELKPYAQTVLVSMLMHRTTGSFSYNASFQALAIPHVVESIQSLKELNNILNF